MASRWPPSRACTTQEQQTQQETLTQLTTDNTALQDQVAGLEERLTTLEKAIQSGQPVQVVGQSAPWGMLFFGALVGAWGVQVSKRHISQSPY